MSTGRDFGPVRYAALCDRGTRINMVTESHTKRLRQVAYLLMQAEEEYPSEVPTYRDELATLKDQIRNQRGHLMAHVAHCTAGCVRDKTGGLSESAFTNDGAPAHNKPQLPPMAEIAARLRNGEALEAIAAEYDRHPDTLRQRLNYAGFNGRDGRTNARPAKAAPAPRHPLIPDEPWRDDALCAQTDPEAFFPEKGGSSREPKSVCAGCTVAAECLDYALEHDERHGIWGGLSERERRKVTRALKESA